MLEHVCAPQRRFFSSLIQRAAKLHKRLGGGSLTLLPVLAGAPARGEGPRPPSAAQYKHLSEAQREKLQAALEAAHQQQLGQQQEGCVRTEVRRTLPIWHCYFPVVGLATAKACTRQTQDSADDMIGSRLCRQRPHGSIQAEKHQNAS